MLDDIRPVTWHDGAVRIIDQTALPGQLAYLDLTSVDALIAAIQRLAVRGAPALGVAGAYGVALALLRGDRAAARINEGFDTVLAAAHAVLNEDLTANRTLSTLGADWLLTRLDRRPLRLLTHCNAGALATAGWGTALGVVRELHARGLVEVVYVDETRPLLQGSRLTAWELARLGIPHLIQADGAASSTIVSGHVDAAIVGADRIAANGDTANKIGTLGVALACAHAEIPFLVAAPTSTVDLATPSGAAIHVELRAESEVLGHASPKDSRAHNPAFDVTPATLISALTTERGVAELNHGQLPGTLWT